MRPTDLAPALVRLFGLALLLAVAAIRRSRDLFTTQLAFSRRLFTMQIGIVNIVNSPPARSPAQRDPLDRSAPRTDGTRRPTQSRDLGRQQLARAPARQTTELDRADAHAD